MTRTASTRTTTALGADKPTAASVLALVQSIERRGPDAPATAAFRSALRRAGLEIDAEGGLAALDDLMHEVADADPDRADTRMAILRSAWGELLPSPGGRAQA